MVAIGNGGFTGSQSCAIDIEWSANAVDCINHAFRTKAPAKAQIGKAENLGKCPCHHDICRIGHQFQTGFVIIAADIFRIGGIQHQKYVRAQCRVQPFDLVKRDVGAGWIIGVGEEHHFGFRGYRGDNAIDLGGIVALRHHNWLGSCRQNRNLVNQKAVLAVNRFIAGPKKGIGQERENFI